MTKTKTIASFSAHALANGFAFPECPRFHDGAVWFSDQHDRRVLRLALDGTCTEAISVPGGPSGLGWLPGGDLLIVAMHERCLYRWHDGALTRHADLAPLHPFYSNDMVVDGAGRAYVGNIGFDFYAGAAPAPTVLVRVDADGTAHVAAENLMCPNGTVISPDGRTLIVAESMAHRLTAFDIDGHGNLSRRRVFAQVDGHVPDGICLDAEGCIWFASPYAGRVVRVREGGEIVAEVTTAGANPYACILGGPDGRDLYICCAPHHDPAKTVAARGGRIDVARVAVGAAGGWP